MTRGRKPRAAEVADAIDTSLDQPKIEGAMAQMRADAHSQRAEEDAQLAQAAQMVGGALMARLHKDFSRAAEVRMFQQLRELPLAVVRRLQAANFPDASGKNAAIPEKLPDASGNLDTLCPLIFGRSYNTMLEEAQNFAALGEQSYEVAARLGVNKAALRAARALPPEKLETVRLAIANGSTKSEVLSVIEDLAVRIEETEQALADARGDLEAKEHLLAEKGKRIDQLKAAQKRIEKLPPDAQLVDLQKEATAIMRDASGAVTGGLRQAIIAVRNHGDEDHTAFLAGLVGQVQADLSALREEFGLPDTSAAAQQELAADAAQWLKKA